MLIAFHGQQTIKDEYLSRVRQHRAANQIVQSYTHWDSFGGSAVGCTVHASNHFAYEQELGIPAHLAFIEDEIFNNLPVDKAPGWAESFLSVIRPSADLSVIWPQFVVWLLDDPADGVIRYANAGTLHPFLTMRARSVIGQVANLFREGCTDYEQWRLAATTARSVSKATGRWSGLVPVTIAVKTAEVAATAAQADAFGASSAASWARAAPRTAAAVVARADRANAYVKQSEKLLELLRAA